LWEKEIDLHPYRKPNFSAPSLISLEEDKTNFYQLLSYNGFFDTNITPKFKMSRKKCKISEKSSCLVEYFTKIKEFKDLTGSV